MKFSNITPKLIFGCLLCVIAATIQSCKSEPKPSATSSSDAAASVYRGDAPAAAEEKEPIRVFDFGAFPHKWIALTKRGGEYVIFTPCNADNRELFLNNDHGKYRLSENMGEDGIEYDILEFKQANETKVEIKVRVPQNKKEQIFTCDYDPKKGTAEWKWKYEFGKAKNTEMLFVDASRAAQYKTVMQPCKECYSAAECAEMDKNMAASAAAKK